MFGVGQQCPQAGKYRYPQRAGEDYVKKKSLPTRPFLLPDFMHRCHFLTLLANLKQYTDYPENVHISAVEIIDQARYKESAGRE
jgi:hypothetical protein